MQPIPLTGNNQTDGQLRETSLDRIVGNGALKHDFGTARSDFGTEQALLKTVGLASFTAPQHKEVRPVAGDKLGGDVRDKVAYMSAAFFSPLALFGLGVAFALYDEFKLLTEKPDAAALKEEARAMLPRYAQIEREYKEKEKLQGSDLTLRTALDFKAENLRVRERSLKVDLGCKNKPFDPEAVKKDYLRMAGAREWTTSRWLNCGAKLSQTNRLLKEKELLTEFIEKTRGKLDLNASSSLHAKIQSLDKSIKKLGVAP